MSRLTLATCWTICTLGAGLAHAQTQPALPAANPPAAAPAAADLPAVRVAVTQISESRSSSGSGSINLTLGISAEGLPPGAVVRQVTVTKAEDNTGRPLPNMARGLSPLGMSMNPGQGGVMRATASIASAPRTAEFIKYIEGTIEIFIPSEATGSLIRIPGVKSHLGRIEHPSLAKYGIIFHFLGDKTSGDEAKAMMASLGGSSSRSGTEFNLTTVGYYYRDPSARLAGYQLQDSRGVEMRSSGGGGGGGNAGLLMAATLQAPLPDDAQLVLFVVTPEATKIVPFRVEEIQLP